MQDDEEHTLAAGDRSSAAIGHRIVRGTLIIIFMWFFWKLGGFLMYFLINSFYGKGLVLDVFTAVYGPVVFTCFYASLLKVVKPAFMPLFAERMYKHGEDAAWELANTVTNLLLLSAIAAGILAFAFAPRILDTLLPEFSAEARAAAAILLRWMTPGFLVLAFSIAALAILTSYKVFSYPSASDAAQKLFWAAGLFVALTLFGLAKNESLAPHVIGATFLLGCLAQLAVLLFGLRKHFAHYRLALPALPLRRIAPILLGLAGAAVLFFAAAWVLRRCVALPVNHAFHLSRHSCQFLTMSALMAIGCLGAVVLWRLARKRAGVMARFAALASPLLISVIFGRYRTLTETFFQSYTREGNFGLIELAKKVANLPTVLIGYAVGIAMIPFLCDLATEDRRKELGRLVGRTLRFMALIFLPLTAVTIVLSRPIMELLWDRGSWSPADGRMASLALAILSVTILVLAIENVLMQSFFSLQQTVLPTAIGIVFSILHALTLYVAIELLDHPASAFLIVCITIAASRALKNLVLLGFLSQRLRLMERRQALAFGGELLFICLATGLAAWLAYEPIAALLPLKTFRPVEAASGINLAFELVKCLRLAIPSLAAFATFLALCAGLRMEEFLMVVRWVRARLPARKA